MDALRETCSEIEKLEDKGKSSKTAAIYGIAGKIPDKTVIEEVAHLYLDACYSMPTAEKEEENDHTEMNGNGEMMELAITSSSLLDAEDEEEETYLSAN